MSDTILLVNASIENELFNVVKTIVKKNKDKRFDFDVLPHIKSMYKNDKLGKIFRNKLMYRDKKLVVCFFYPLELETSLPLILEIMEFFDKVILVCQKQDYLFFDTEKFSSLLGVDVLECDTNKHLLNSTLDTIKSDSISLFYKSQSYINYGYDMSVALGFIDYIVRDKFKIENSNWLSIRLLEGDKNFLKEYSEKSNKQVLDNKEVLKQIATAKKYLYNYDKNFDISLHIQQIKNSIIDIIVNSALETEQNDFSYFNKDYLLVGVFWFFVVWFFLFGYYIVINL